MVKKKTDGNSSSLWNGFHAYNAAETEASGRRNHVIEDSLPRGSWPDKTREILSVQKNPKKRPYHRKVSEFHSLVLRTWLIVVYQTNLDK